MRDALPFLVMIALVFATAWHHFGWSAFGITAAVWLLMPFNPRGFRSD